MFAGGALECNFDFVDTNVNVVEHKNEIENEIEEAKNKNDPIDGVDDFIDIDEI